MTFLIGDVHGKYDRYKKIIKAHKDTIVVGDMGVGFRRFSYHGPEDAPFLANPPYDLMVENNARFIRGNHDNPSVCRKHTQWIKDGTFEGDRFFLGGAFSIDWKLRHEGYDWWKDEQLSHEEFDKIIDPYTEKKPRVVVTHDCPLEMIGRIHSHHYRDNSITQQFLQALFERHQPEEWYFGHHHKKFEMTVNGTKFRCLDELEVTEI